MTTQRRHHATISGEDLYRRVIETARSGKRLPAGALLTADNYADFISSMTNARGVDDMLQSRRWARGPWAERGAWAQPTGLPWEP